MNSSFTVECAVVGVLLRIPGEERDAGEQIDCVAADAPRNQPMQGRRRNRLRDAQHPQVEQPHRADEQRQPEEVQRLAQRPQPHAVLQHERRERRASYPHFPWLHHWLEPRRGGVDHQSRVRVREQTPGSDHHDPQQQ